ncbi:hypothetical protein B0H19DRAFT_1256239 [Mycena capillaripes]|nr:hypothetical protein B0H19DRAFT_1256239 [Mycena capillaripes]
MVLDPVTITVGILPKVLDTSDHNDTLDLSPRYFWKSGDEIERVQHALQRANLIFTVDVNITGPIVEAIDTAFKNHCESKRIDYVAPRPVSAPVTPNTAAWVLTGPRGRSSGRTWVEDPKSLTRFTFTLQALRNIPFSYTPNNLGEGPFIFIVPRHRNLFGPIDCLFDPTTRLPDHVLTHKCFSRRVLYPILASLNTDPEPVCGPSCTPNINMVNQTVTHRRLRLPSPDLYVGSDSDDDGVNFPEAEMLIERMVRNGLPPLLVTNDGTESMKMDTPDAPPIVTRSVWRQQWQEEATATAVPVSSVTPFIAGPLLTAAMELTDTFNKEVILHSSDYEYRYSPTASIACSYSGSLLRPQGYGIFVSPAFPFHRCPAPGVPFLFSTIFDGRRTAAKFDIDFLTPFSSAGSLSFITKIGRVPLDKPLYASQSEDCIEYQYLLNIPEVDPTLISPHRFQEEQDGVCSSVISFLTLGTVDIEHQPDFGALGDGFNAVGDAFNGQERPHHILEWFATPCRELILAAFDRQVKASTDIISHLEFTQTNPENDLWGENDEILLLITRFVTHYLTEPGHPVDPEHVIDALVDGDDIQDDPLLRAKLFLVVLTGSMLLPVKPTWKVKCLIVHDWSEAYPTTDADGRDDFGPEVSVSFRTCFKTFTITNNARLRQLLLSEKPVQGRDTEFGRFLHGQLLASRASYTSS